MFSLLTPVNLWFAMYQIGMECVSLQSSAFLTSSCTFITAPSHSHSHSRSISVLYGTCCSKGHQEREELKIVVEDSGIELTQHSNNHWFSNISPPTNQIIGSQSTTTLKQYSERGRRKNAGLGSRYAIHYSTMNKMIHTRASILTISYVHLKFIQMRICELISELMIMMMLMMMMLNGVGAFIFFSCRVFFFCSYVRIFSV